jgi:hypothetical protein
MCQADFKECVFLVREPNKGSGTGIMVLLKVTEVLKLACLKDVE